MLWTVYSLNRLNQMPSAFQFCVCLFVCITCWTMIWSDFNKSKCDSNSILLSFKSINWWIIKSMNLEIISLLLGSSEHIILHRSCVIWLTIAFSWTFWHSNVRNDFYLIDQLNEKNEIFNWWQLLFISS